MAWSPDGKRLALLAASESGIVDGASSGLSVIEIATGKQNVWLTSSALQALRAKLAQSKQGGSGSTEPLTYQPRTLALAWTSDGHTVILSDSYGIARVGADDGAEPRVLVAGKQPIADVKLSPAGNLISFIRAGRIYLLDTASGMERPLTAETGASGRSQGELSRQYRDAFPLDTGYWWSPDGAFIAYLETDEGRRSSPGMQVPLSKSDLALSQPRFEAEQPAEPVRLMLAQISVAKDGGALPSPIVLMEPGPQQDYVVRSTWLPGGKQLLVEKLSKAQDAYELQLIDVANGPVQSVLRETDQYWINLGSAPRFLKDRRRFLWTSERSGHRHLYLCDLDSTREPQPLTDGAWDIRDLIALDEKKGAAYVTTSEVSPVENHLFAVSLADRSRKRLTQASGWHQPRLAPDSGMVADVFSNASAAPKLFLLDPQGRERDLAGARAQVQPSSSATVLPTEFFSFDTHDDAKLHGFLIKPAHFDAHRKYPLIIEASAGPGEQIVQNRWRGAVSEWHQALAQRGFVIVGVDPRGSGGYGHFFEEPIHYWLGGQESSDLRDALMYLRQMPFVDGKHVGIWGSGYGGQLALNAGIHNPEGIAAAYADAPVVDWLTMNPIFAERYLGFARQHPEEYRQSSVIDSAERLRGPVLISARLDEELTAVRNALELQSVVSESGRTIPVVLLPRKEDPCTSCRPMLSLSDMADQVTQFFVQTLTGTR